MLLVVGIMNLVIGVLNAFSGNAVGAVNVALATLLMYGLGRIHGKIEQLELERTLHE
jgi:hypothetical protein